MSERARNIVQRAAAIAKDSSTKDWLHCDSRGTFEHMVDEYIQKTEARAVELGMAPTDVDEQIANRILLDALDAHIRHRAREARKARAK